MSVKHKHKHKPNTEHSEFMHAWCGCAAQLASLRVYSAPSSLSIFWSGTVRLRFSPCARGSYVIHIHMRHERVCHIRINKDL